MPSNEEFEKIIAERDLLLQKLEHQAAEFEGAKKELNRLSQIKDNFLSIASHELRTPMSVIRGYTDFLLSENFGNLNDQQKNFLTKILRNVGQLTNLINNMLDISKLEAGKMQFVFSSVPLRDLIESVIEDHRILFSEKHQTLAFKCELDVDPHINTDPEKLSIICANLISNAYKFTPEKGKITITLSQPDTAIWQIAVADTGIGINDAQKECLFEKFQQIDNSLQKHYSGTGLGLSIVREILERLNGKIWVEDNPDADSGSIFKFTIPA